MPTITINDAEIHFEDAGHGPPLVFVHGNWDGGDVWDALRPELEPSFRVVSYDRRGHSRSERPPEGWTRRSNEDDLAGLIEALDLSPAHVVGNSYGGLIALGLASRRPELLRGVTVHEPPAVGLLDERAGAEIAGPLGQVMAEIESGDTERATRRFMDQVALGPGAWEAMPESQRTALAGNAPAFAVELADPDWPELELAALDRVDGPVQVTRGDASPPWLIEVAGLLASAIPGAELATVAGAGHAPQETHPAGYAEVLREFAREPAQVSI